MSLDFLYLISTGRRRVPRLRAPAFEFATGGLFTRQKLFPQHWREWWPELAENADRGAA